MQQEFSRTEILIGEEGIELLAKAKVAVFGLGGVGSYVVEALARCGIGSLILVDLSAVEATAKTAPAVKRDYSVIPDSEGGSLDAYTYTGNFRAKGDKVKGTATTDDGWQTITFSDGSEELE